MKKRNNNKTQKTLDNAKSMRVCKIVDCYEQEETLKSNILHFNETLHEVRKINNQLKASADQLYKEIRALKGDYEEMKEIINISKNIEANTNLLSIRMDAYDMMSNPGRFANDMIVETPIYRKVEKVYKCLHAKRKEKNLNISLKGKTEMTFKLNSMIELAFFIIIENAIKYSPDSGEISVDFLEGYNCLTVRFKNWGICPKAEELPFLYDRGFRAEKIINTTSIEGSGLGLFLLKEICTDNGVDVKIVVGDERFSQKGYNYKPFIVTLIFHK